jgi:hypothetical protein
MQTCCSKVNWRDSRLGVFLASSMLMATAVLNLALPPFQRSAHAEQCRTKLEAERAFPTAHLYWHTSAHCWDNVPTDAFNVRERLRPHREAADRPQPTTSEQVLAATTIYPMLIRGPQPSADFFYPGTFDRQPLLIDIDRPTQFIPWDRRISGTTQ